MINVEFSIDDSQNKFFDPRPEDTLWRYMELAKFLDLIHFKRLFFSRLDKLTDQYEGKLPLKNKFEEYYKTHAHDTVFGPVIKEQEKKAETTLINCWSQSECESFALWKINLGGNKGVAVKTTFGKLMKSLDPNDKVQSALIDYPRHSFEKNPEIANFATTKNPYYEYERELRLFLFNQMEKGEPLKTGKYININLDFIDAIYTFPMSQNWFVNLVNEEVVKLGLTAKVLPSDIKDKIFL